MPTAIHRRVRSAREGSDPTVIARLASGWAVMGDPQVLRGYCLLLPDPVVDHLNAFGPRERDQFLADMARLGDAVLRATGALRVNYAMLGNVEPALHAHVFPRHGDEPPQLRQAHPWARDWSAAPAFDARRDGELLAAIRRILLSGTPTVNRVDGSIHHIDLTVSNLARSTAFYERVFPLLGFRRMADCAEGPLWRGMHTELGLQEAQGAGVERGHDRSSPGLHHLALAAPSRKAVDEVFRILQASGVSILDPPAQYDQYSAGYYAVFFLDPDGIKLEYVYTPQTGE